MAKKTHLPQCKISLKYYYWNFYYWKFLAIFILLPLRCRDLTWPLCCFQDHYTSQSHSRPGINKGKVFRIRNCTQLFIFFSSVLKKMEPFSGWGLIIPCMHFIIIIESSWIFPLNKVGQVRENRKVIKGRAGFDPRPVESLMWFWENPQPFNFSLIF